MEYKLYRTDDLKEFESLDEAVFYAKKHDVEYITESIYTDDDITTKKVWNKVEEAKYDLNDAIKRFNAKMSKKNKEVKHRITGEPVKNMAFFNKAMGSSDGIVVTDGGAVAEDLNNPKVFKIITKFQYANGPVNKVEDFVVANNIKEAKSKWQNAKNLPLLDSEISEVSDYDSSRFALDATKAHRWGDYNTYKISDILSINNKSFKEGAEGKKEPGFEYVIYDSDEANEKAPIVAIRSTRVEAEHFINVNDFGKRKYGHLDYERVPKGKFNKGDDFWGPFDKDYNRI